MTDILLARYAECIFWLARYVERAENLTRLLAATDAFAHDRSGGSSWLPVVTLNADGTRFFERYKAASADTVLRFYVPEAANPSSIAAAIRNARENARTLRPLIANEMWVQLNILHGRISGLSDNDLSPENRGHLFDEIRLACQTHTGIAEGTFYRDQSWYFYRLGRYIERADQCTRLLDVKYHLLLPKTANVGSPVDVAQWNALLRQAAAYHAYLRLHPAVTPEGVAEFLLLNPIFPRSLHFCVGEVESLLTHLKSRFLLRGGVEAAEMLDEMRATLRSTPISRILVAGLHEFLDLTQQQLVAVTDSLGTAFFGHAPVVAQVQAADGQGQGQSA